MPRIRAYEQQISSQGDFPGRSASPSDLGGTGMVNLGQGVGNLGADIAQAQRFMLANKSRQEVTDAQTMVLRLGSDLSQELTARHKSWKPGDPSIAESFQGLVKQRLDNIGYTDDGTTERFTTTAGNQAFRTAAERLSASMIEHASRADADLQGKAAVIAHDQLVNDMGNFLINHPAYYNLRKDEVASIIRDPHGQYANIPAVEREKLVHIANEKLALAAAEGFVRKSPHLALEVLNDPALKQDEQYSWLAEIPGDKMDDLKTKAHTEIRALEAEEARLEAQKNRDRIARAREAETGLIGKIAAHMDDHKQPMLSAGDVMKSTLLEDDPEKAKALLTLIHAWSREDPYRPTHTDPATMRELVRRIHAPDGSHEKLVDNLPIYEAYDKKKLSFTDLKNLNQEFNDARTPEGMKLGQTKEHLIKAMAPQLDHSNPMMGKIDRSGPANVFAYEQMVNRKIDEFRKEGKDVYALFDPNSTEYLGKPERLRPFQKHMLDSIRDFSESLKQAPGQARTPSGGVPDEKQRKAGETPAQYLERIGK